MKYAQIVMGPAGTGKSTYCRVLQEHCSASGRTVRIGNMDPAAENFEYQVTFDIRDLISVDDVMSEVQLGPNGALLYTMSYLSENLEWFSDQLDDFGDEDYLILDCPGQIELYTHIPIMKTLIHELQSKGFNVVAVYCIDATFITDPAKLIAGMLTALSAMVHLELPHINILTKCDLADKKSLEAILSPSGAMLANALNKRLPPSFQKLNVSLANLLDNYDMVAFVPLDITNEDSIDSILLHIDHILQFGENAEPKEPKDEFNDNDNDNNNDGEYGEGSRNSSNTGDD